MKIKENTTTGRTTRKSITVSTDKGDLHFNATITQGLGHDITDIEVDFIEAVGFDPTQEEIEEAQEFAEMNL